MPAITFFIATFLIVAPARSQDPAPPPPSSAAPAGAPDDQTPIFKTGVVDVRLDVQVTQGDTLVRSLKKDDFEVRDDGAPQPIVGFAHGSERLSLLILLDVSGSMTRYLDQIANTARDALKFLQPGDRVAIMVFGKRSELHQGFSDNLAESARQLANAIHEHDVGAGTHINQAVLDAAQYVGKNAGPDGRRAILILTDNLSLSYMLPDQRVIRELNDNDTVLDAIVVGRAIRPDSKPGESQNPDFTPADVFKLAEETGGEAVKVNSAARSFAEMVERIRSRYTLAYHAPEAKPGTYRQIAVTLTPDARKWYPAAIVRVRPGYWVK